MIGLTSVVGSTGGDAALNPTIGVFSSGGDGVVCCCWLEGLPRWSGGGGIFISREGDLLF